MTPPAWDYEHAYPGGTPPGGLLPLARPLYPPDANEHGKKPSGDGPDCEAIRRGLSRGGRIPWSWATGQNKRKWSNTLAHGAAGGNVGDSGAAGFQRQMNIGDSGWWGAESHKAMQYALVPEGLPHAGEHLLDARALELLADAAELFGEQARDVALEHLAARVGWVEDPDGSNCDHRADGIRESQDRCAGGGTWLRGEPWCGCWCYYALELAGVKGLDSSLASVAQIEDNARAGAKCFTGWTTDRSRVRPGDLVVIGGYGVHVETVRAAPSSSSTPTYGGNTSPGTGGSQSNGGGAYARTRYPSEVRGYALVRYPGD